MKAILLAATLVAVPLTLAGCVSDPNISIGQPEYVRLADNKRVPITYPALQPIRKGCGARYQSISNTQDVLYGPYADYPGQIDDLRNCFYRHGYRMYYRHPDGKTSPYKTRDKRLEF